MKQTTLNRLSRLICVALVFAVSGASCNFAKDINRVQNNYVDKSTFDGEWYYRAAVVDKQFNQASNFVGSECDLDRVRFEVTENMLRAYRSYEKVPGTEGANPGQQTLVAAFPILKHFDIKRDYNDQNGVESNVVIENDFDRPWWERKYIRVDWSTNKAPDVQCNDWIKAETLQQIPRNPSTLARDAFRVRISSDYLETTIDALAKPQEGVCSYVGDWNCVGSRVRLKFSFKKIEKGDYEKMLYPDYEPLKYGKTEKGDLCTAQDKDCKDLKELWLNYTPSGAEMCDPTRHNIDDCVQYEVPVFSRFGFFRTERQHFDRENGFTLSGREQLINRWNIWQKSKNDDGTTIPLADRVPKPIIYYLNVQFPHDLVDTAQAMADDWSVAFADTVAKLKGSCSIQQVNHYIDKNGLRKDMKALGLAVVTEANVKLACEKVGELSTTKKLATPFFSGDHKQISQIYGKLFQIRFNDCNLASVNAYAREHKLESELSENGIATVEEGNLEEACAVLEFVSKSKSIEKPFQWQQLGDLRYSFINYTSKAELAGPLGYGPSATDPLSGEIISGNANIYGAELDTYAAWGADIVQLVNGDISDVDVMNGSQIREHIEGVRRRYAQTPAAEIGRFSRLLDARIGKISDREYLQSIPLSSIGENMLLLKKSGLEEQYLVSDDMARLFGPSHALGGIGNASAEGFERARPSNWAKPILPSYELLLGRQGASKMGLDAQGSQGSELLSVFNRRVEFFGQRSACYLAEAMEPAVADLALSLKGKSWDEAYKMIRANIFRGVTAHEIGHTLGLRHNFEASADAMNYFPAFWGVDTGDHRMSQSTSRTSEMRYASIMDYQQRFNSDFGGIGLYDKAAIKFGYGKLIEVFDESDGAFVPKDWATNADLFHYRDLPYLYAGVGANAKLNTHYNAIRDQYQRGNEKAMINIQSLGIAPKPENLFKRRDVSYGDYYRSLVSRMFGKEGGPEADLHEVPYRYCSDAYASGGNITCNLWDMGASAEEIVANAEEMYDAYYPFNSFRGDRIAFSPQSYMGRLYSRTYQPMLNTFRYLYYYRRSSMRIWPLMQDWTAAAYKGLNFFGRVLQTVEPGKYCLNSSNLYVPQDEVATCEKPVDIGLGQGRFYNTSWTQDFFFKPNNVGHMYDKLLAMQALTDSAAFFTRDFTASFSRGAFSIGYYRVFAPEMTSLFTSILMNDHQFAPHLVSDAGEHEIQYQPLAFLSDDNHLIQAPRIRPSSSWIMRYYALFLPMLNYTSTIDRQMDYAKRARVSIVGSKHDPVVDPSIKQIVFTDPMTQIQYRSLAPDGEQLAPGYQLLKEAQAFVKEANGTEPAGLWRQAKNRFERAKVELTKASATVSAKVELKNAEFELDQRNAELLERMQLIDLLRLLSEMLDYGA